MQNDDFFSRTEMLLGSTATVKLRRARVIIFGIGGVGSWCAEGLIRSGIGNLTIVDSDTISVSNINRQLHATSKTVGQKKVDILRERLLEINPNAAVTAIHKVYSENTYKEFELETFDVIIDAIDSLANKMHLILRATETKAAVFSSMGAALKINPSEIKTAEFWKVMGCPLAAALRRRFKKSGQFPSKKFQCVYSTEQAYKNPNGKNHILGNQTEIFDESIKAVTNGAICHITAIFGFTLSYLAIRHLIQP